MCVDPDWLAEFHRIGRIQYLHVDCVDIVRARTNLSAKYINERIDSFVT